MSPHFSTTGQIRHNAEHYNSITDAWRHILGDNFHLGYFENGEGNLDEATERLVDKMASYGNIASQSRVLDVGCGVGGPAIHLHEKLGCSIVGISTSQKGVEQAERESQKKEISRSVQFRVVNALENGFADESFDVVWVMETSHLITDKRKLFAECKRVLKPGGKFVLCDFMLSRRYTLRDRLKYFSMLKLDYITGVFNTIRAFGRMSVETVEFHERAALDIGFRDFEILDISDRVKPTFKHWIANVEGNLEEILKTLSLKQVDQIIKGSNLCDYLFDQKVFGYWLMRAVK
jgi:27-O-demethylrifamycin SV methyltransferase